MLAREVLHLRGSINKSMGFIISLHSGTSEIMPDLYFHREPQEIAVEEEEEKRQIDESAVQPEITVDQSGWGDTMEVEQPSTEERVVEIEPEVSLFLHNHRRSYIIFLCRFRRPRKRRS